MRLTFLCWVLMVLVGALTVYEVKYEVRDIKRGVHTLEEQITQERESLHVLDAEWAYLTRPERLQSLSQKFLHLQPVKPLQIRDEANLGLQDKTAPDKNLASAGEGMQ